MKSKINTNSKVIKTKKREGKINKKQKTDKND